MIDYWPEPQSLIQWMQGLWLASLLNHLLLSSSCSLSFEAFVISWFNEVFVWCVINQNPSGQSSISDES